MTKIEITVETIESIIDDYLEWYTNKVINCVDDLLKTFRDYIDDTNYESEFNLDNIINYYNIDDLDELDDLLKDVVVDYSESTQDEIDKLQYDDIYIRVIVDVNSIDELKSILT